MQSRRHFQQVDVFTSVPFKGNPLAVVLDAEGLSDEQMQAIARWTNLSETTFILPATDPAADYRVRIFSPATEFPFAGHPTLGSAHALLTAGLQPKTPGRLVQQCGVGLVPLTLGTDGALAFAAPAASERALDTALLPLLDAALHGAAAAAPLPPVAVDMGIRWLVLRLPTAEACLAVRADPAALEQLSLRSSVDGVAVYGPHPPGGPADYEVRALFVENGVLVEDPVTGSANACIARVLQSQGFPDGAASRAGYSVRQGTRLARDGRLSVRYQDGQPWIGGQCVTVVDGFLQA